MFNFMSMADNYEDRKIDRFNGEDFTVDTCSVNDSDQPYETGIQHPKYNDNAWVIVEMYETKNKAKKGHDKWVKIMTKNILPKELKDVSTSEIAKLLNSFE